MRHHLIPPFILEYYAAGQRSGRFDAVCLFVDTSGFTPLTTAMMAHGAEGAETVANTLSAVFSPLVRAVYARGGFIAAFAGDAFKAVFPLDQPDAYRRAATVAWEIRQRMTGHQHVDTPFGAFELAVKATLADGEVVWGVWQRPEVRSKQPAAGGSAGQWAAYWFEGTALARCVEADPLAAAGEVVLTDAVYRRLADQGAEVTAEPVADHWRLLALNIGVVADEPTRPVAVIDRQESADFYPADLLEMPVQGEFRRVVTVFINLKDMPDDAGFVDTLFRLLAQYEGYLCRIGRIGERDRGATLLLFWGAPLSHENDLARALGFLLELRQTQPGLALRAGATMGLAYAGYIGSEQREEYTCHGATVNLAARLMVTATWGNVWLDEETARLAQAQFDLDPVGWHHLKGINAAQTLYRLAGRRETGEAAFFRGAMVGRQAELAKLQAALQPLTNGHFGGVITVLGEAGLGKSRLVHELVADAPWRVQLCPCDDIVRPSLHPFRHWLRRYFNQSNSATEAENQARFDRALSRLTDKSPDPALTAELERTRSALGALVDLRWEGSLYEQLDPQGRFENTLLALKVMILAESLRRPLVLHIEDAHWLDSDSWHFLARLVRNVATYPFAVMLTGRPELEKLTFAPDTLQLDIALEPLRAADLAQLANDLLNEPAASALVTMLVERAEGNPFFAEQLLLFLREKELLTVSPGGLAPAGGADAVPLDVRTVLVARIDRLSAEVRRVVQTAAVLGREFELHLLTAMLYDEPLVRQCVTTAADAAVWTALSELRYLFRHALLRDAAYEMQLLATRRGLHRLAGEAIEALNADDLAPQYGQLAYHFAQAAESEKAINYLQLAGDQAREQYQNNSALDYYGRLLALLRSAGAAETSDRETLTQSTITGLIGRGEVLHRVGRWDEAEADLDDARVLAAAHGDEFHQAQAEYLLGYVYLNRTDFERAIDMLDRSASLFEHIGFTEKLCLALNRLGQAFWRSGRGDRAMACHSRALALARAGNHRSEVALSLLDLGTVHMFRDEFDQSLACFEEGLRIYEELGRRSAIGSLRTNLGICYARMGNDRLALENYHLSLALSRELGYKIAVSRTLGNLGTLYANLGQLEQAIAYYQEGLAVDVEQGNEAGMAWHLANLGEVYAMQGQYDQALETMERGIAILRNRGTRHLLAEALVGKGHALLALGRLDEARPVQEEAFRFARQINHRDSVFQAQLLGARLSAAAGDRAAAVLTLNAMFADAAKEAELAAIHYELWRLDASAEHRMAALAYYRRLAATSAVHEYHSRLQELQAAA